MMKELLVSVINDLILYNNNRFLLPLFIIAIIYLWRKESDKTVRSVLIYMSVALSIIFICPVYAYVGNKVDSEIYYRVWWCIPMGVVICYAFTKFAFSQKSLMRRLICGIAILLIVAGTGKLVYTNSTRFVAENKKHLPQFVVDVADAVTAEYDSPHCVMPLEIAIYIRQYNAKILVPFSRFNFTGAGVESDLYNLMIADTYDVEKIAELAKINTALYVVFYSGKGRTGNIEDYGFTYLGQVDGYEVYRYEQLYLDYIEYGEIVK